MALTAQPPAHASWSRWPQQLPQEFSMMDAPNFLPYDSRSLSAPQMQRAMPPQYVVDGHYSQPPMHPMPAPQYQSQNTFTYMSYQSPPPSNPISSPYKQEFPERPAQRMLGGAVTDRRSSRPMNEYRPRSPMSRSGSISSASNSKSSVVPSPVANAKTITYNETINPADQVNFETDVDELMKAIQKRKQEKRDEESTAANMHQTITPAHTPKSEGSMDVSSPAPLSSECKPKKKWVCDGPSCNKSFVQKTHLDIHRRTHTGLKPYVCTKDNCGLTFSQRGNLKTHMRRHTGEKPYSCSLCGKLFAQRGNVRSHEETHKGLKPFICRLDDCNKTFSQLGNMKTHQNNFHKETLQKLTNQFVQFLNEGEVPETHRELFDYFQEHYKNSNKGIKGRGKARTVAARKPKGGSTQSAASTATTTSPSPNASQFPPAPMSGHQAVHSASRIPSYELSAHGPPHSMDNMPRNPAPVYAMYDQQQPSHSAMLYEDEHPRQIGYNGRLY